MKRLSTLALALGGLLPCTLHAAPQTTLSGLVEVEISDGDATDFSGDSVRDVVLATAELGIESRINNSVGARVVLLYEEDETDLTLDVATLSLRLSNMTTLSAGRDYVPFGRFETHMVSDPLTLELGETSETMLMVDMEDRGAYFNAYLFNGDSQEYSAAQDDSFTYGSTLGYGREGAFDLGAGYISNLADSDALQAIDVNGDGVGSTGGVAAEVAGLNIYLQLQSGPWSFYAEQVAAQDSFAAGDFDGELTAAAKPVVNHYELAYAISADSVLAVSYQQSEEAQFLGLPERVTGVAFGSSVSEAASVTLEYHNAEDYAQAEGGSGKDATLYTVQLAVAF